MVAPEMMIINSEKEKKTEKQVLVLEILSTFGEEIAEKT